MSKITLTDLVNLQNETTAVNAINNNNSVLETAFDNTLSRDGTSPNTMGANLDMNSKRVLNLPVPINGSEPLRLQDAATLNGGGTITSGLTSVGLTMPADFNVAGSPLTANGTLAVTLANTATGTGGLVRATSPTLVTPNIGVATATSVNKMAITAPGTSSTLTVANGKTLTANNTLTLAGTDSTTLTFQGTDTYVGRTTTDTLTNKTFVAPVLGAATATSITFNPTTGGLVGTPTNNAASAGIVGELITSNVLVGSAVALTSTLAANVTSISLTAGDWDVWGVVWLSPNAATTSTLQSAWVNTTSATSPSIPGTNTSKTQYWMNLPAGGGVNIPTGIATLQLASTTTVYLETAITFAVNTMSAYGTIWARRVR